MDPITLAILGFGAYALLKSGSNSNGFIYRKRNGEWRAYFNGNPSSKNHVLYDRYGYYVCWDRPLRTKHEARQIARRWKDIYG